MKRLNVTAARVHQRRFASLTKLIGRPSADEP
jgi:hypothetical protein